jgi:hypothetical protein
MLKNLFPPLLVITSMAVQTFAATPHTFHNVTASDNAECSLKQIFESGFYFSDTKGASVEDFNLTATQVFTYGFVINSTTVNFNLLYALTCVRSDGLFQKSPKVSFTVGANGPANPNIHVNNFYGAQGTWKTVPGIGENFNVVFP